jgi:heterodisulfide reductase subunit A
VITQLEFERILAGLELDNTENQKVFPDLTNLKSIAMIQCVGSRNNEHPYCSRVCCAKAIKNTLKIKQKNPDVMIYIIYQDIMTYGLQERYYKAAREEGVEFLRYEPDEPPKVIKEKKSGNLKISLKDILLNQELILEPDVLVLSNGIEPNSRGLEAFDKLGIEYSPTYFLQEANIKFRPVDVLVDGIFIAGLAHSPRQIGESIIQAEATAGRALTILNRSSINSRSDVSEVISRKCSGCEACISACPYHARIMNPVEKEALVLEPT